MALLPHALKKKNKPEIVVQRHMELPYHRETVTSLSLRKVPLLL